MDPNSLVPVAAAPVAVVPSLLYSLLLSTGSAALGGLLWLLGQGAVWVAGRIKNQKLRDAWLMASDYAQKVVRDVAGTYVGPLKAEGKWTEATAQTAKAMAVDKLTSMLEAQADAKAMGILSGAKGTPAALQSVAGTFIESAVHDLGAAADGAAAALVPAAAPVVNITQTQPPAAVTVVAQPAAAAAASEAPKAPPAPAAPEPKVNPTPAPVAP